MATTTGDSNYYLRRLVEAESGTTARMVKRRWQTWELEAITWAKSHSTTVSELKAIHENRVTRLRECRISWASIRRCALDNPVIPEEEFRLSLDQAQSRTNRGRKPKHAHKQ